MLLFRKLYWGEKLKIFLHFFDFWSFERFIWLHDLFVFWIQISKLELGIFCDEVFNFEIFSGSEYFGIYYHKLHFRELSEKGEMEIGFRELYIYFNKYRFQHSVECELIFRVHIILIFDSHVVDDMDYIIWYLFQTTVSVNLSKYVIERIS